MKQQNSKKHRKSGASAKAKASTGTKVIPLSRIARMVRNVLFASSIAVAPGTVFADPVNGVIGHDSGGGSAITPNAGAFEINQTGSALYIDWDSFNLAGGETVTFHQPANAVALNNILDASPTSILGAITADARIFLINPNGIVFGGGSSVNVNGLVASSLEITEANFQNGNYTFTQGAAHGDVTNAGAMNSTANGFITLVGRNVENQAGGTIVATQGQVNLVSATAVTLDFAMNGLMQFTVNTGSTEGDGSAVTNAGGITANNGWVVMSAKVAGNVIANTVNHTGDDPVYRDRRYRYQ